MYIGRSIYLPLSIYMISFEYTFLLKSFDLNRISIYYSIWIIIVNEMKYIIEKTIEKRKINHWNIGKCTWRGKAKRLSKCTYPWKLKGNLPAWFMYMKGYFMGASDFVCKLRAELQQSPCNMPHFLHAMI